MDNPPPSQKAQVNNLENSVNGAGNNTPDPATNVPKDNPLVETPKSKKKFLILALALLLLVIAGLGFGYKKYSLTKFNSLAKQISQQELTSTKNYVSLYNRVNDVEAAYVPASTSPEASTVANLKTAIASLNTSVNKACDQKNSDLTKKQVIQKINRFWLSGAQKDFITQKAQILNGLESSQYSSVGSCKDGTLILSVFNNLSVYTGGIQQLLLTLKSPTTANINALKKFESNQIIDETSLRSQLPQTTKILDDMQSILSNSYLALLAQSEGKTQDAVTYSKKITEASTSLGNDQPNFENELKAMDARETKASIDASNSELALQEKYKSSKFSDVDAAIPALRIIDSVLTKYTDAHNASYPSAGNIKDLLAVTADQDMASLNSKHLLDGFSYASLGNDHSGFSLSTTLKDGTSLAIKLLPANN